MFAIFTGITDILLGIGCFYFSLVADRQAFIFFAFLSSAYFCLAYKRIEREVSRAKRRKRRRVARPILWYEDRGQAYAYVVKSGDTHICCFSNYLFRPDSPVGLVDILVKDGKIAVRDGDNVEITVSIRKDNYRRILK